MMREVKRNCQRDSWELYAGSAPARERYFQIKPARSILWITIWNEGGDSLVPLISIWGLDLKLKNQIAGPRRESRQRHDVSAAWRDFLGQPLWAPATVYI